MYGEGISKEGDLLDMATQAGLIDKSGAWYAYKDERIGQGRENAKVFLKEHPDIAREIREKVLTHFSLQPRHEKEDTPEGSETK